MGDFSKVFKFLFTYIFVCLGFLVIPIVLLTLGLNLGGFFNFFNNYSNMPVKNFISFFGSFVTLNYLNIIYILLFLIIAPVFTSAFLAYVKAKNTGERFNHITTITTIKSDYVSNLFVLALVLISFYALTAILSAVLLFSHGLFNSLSNTANLITVILAILLFLVYAYINLRLLVLFFLLLANLTLIGFSFSVSIKNAWFTSVQNTASIHLMLGGLLIICFAAYLACMYLFSFTNLVCIAIGLFLLIAPLLILTVSIFIKHNNIPLVEGKKKDYYKK